MAKNVRTIVMSETAMQKMLQDQGITSMDKLVQQTLDVARTGPHNESVDVIVSSHFVYWHAS
jgi:hypothetical protein